MIADVYAPNSGFGTYWSARTYTSNVIRGCQEPPEGVALGNELYVDWAQVEPRNERDGIHILFHRHGICLKPGSFLDSVPVMFNSIFAMTGWGWLMPYAVLSAEVLHTELAVELAAAWTRLARPEQFPEAYARYAIVLGNAGRSEELQPVGAFRARSGDPLRRTPRILPQQFPVQWSAPADSPSGLWQRHQWFLLMNDRRKSEEALVALEKLAADESVKDRFLKWFRENRSEARQRWERLNRSSRDVLAEDHPDALPALAEMIRFYQRLAEAKDYVATIGLYSDKELFTLIEAFGTIQTYLPMEHADLLLYAIEKRRMDRWDWTPLHLTNAARVIAKHYRYIRAHPVYRIALAQVASAPELVELVGMDPQSQRFRTFKVNVFNHATKELNPLILRSHFDREAILDIYREIHPLFETFKADADYFAINRQVAGIRRQFYENYFNTEVNLDLIETNFEKWWDLAESDPQTSLRSAIQAQLQFHVATRNEDVEKTLRLAELMIFHPIGQTRLHDRVRSLCLSSVHFRNDPQATKRFVEGMTRLLDRLEKSPEAEGIDMEENRSNLTKYLKPASS